VDEAGRAARRLTAAVRNWAGNVAYSTSRVLRPRTVEEARELVAGNDRIRALGTRHSFTGVADGDGALLSTEHLDRVVEIGETTVTVEAGIRYGELAVALHEHGLALANFASLPHISVGGAVATATHGSGARNPSLASAVSALELVTASGELLRLERGDDDFDGAVVALGALGVVARLTLDVVPVFDLRQYIFDPLPWHADLDAVLAAAYSVSLFTLWTDDGVEPWVKTTDELDTFFGAAPATSQRHPIAGMPPENTTDQLGVPGPSHERLPHFRLGFTPSGGDELQSEYAVAREHGAAAIEAIRALGPQITPLLLVSEIRAVAADTLWLSPFCARDSVTIHCTWKPLGGEVAAILPRIEDALAPFAPRPHWGKLFALSPSAIVYPQLPAFRELRARLDPGRKFGNGFVERYLGT
jgi:alditol oxidase